ncbi:hypothetical protein DFJ58DRAFT_844145 [Suillus subalutaceus]|uniref:uncharacterized protein n=1 Tax=Suillus subalutaceus TaxID=48586 RepID=UPI001B8719D9|nr:uncharacterized protein DFJ58DRAFT_844145 [Suillus subalutaceus]KAG1844075.1 hypothetical protein DFJ58DRAFT_844145 [Suillus subalutaceus]
MAFQLPEGLDHLNYLDLHGALKSQFKIKLSAEFLFEKHQGYFCLFPVIQTSLRACELIERRKEKPMLDRIHTLLSSTIAPEVCRHWFSWETVELPEDMLQRLVSYTIFLGEEWEVGSQVLLWIQVESRPNGIATEKDSSSER